MKSPVSRFVALMLILSTLSVSIVISQPAYEAGSWVKTGGPIGGLGYDIRHSFENLDQWYVTDAWGGIFLSEDRGLTWNVSNEGIYTRKGLDGVPVFCVTVNPHNSNHIWIGTELTGKIYKSVNGGQSWVEKSVGISDTLVPLSFRGITIDPVSPEIMFAMAEISSSAWNPTGETLTGLELDLTKGIVYKSNNEGESWREVWRGDNLARYCFINPKNTQEIYVSTGIFDRESANTVVDQGIAGGVGILKSEDGGETWRILDGRNGLKDLYIGSLFMHPVNPDTLLAAASQNNWSSYGEEFTGGIYITSDGGENWQKLTEETELFAVVEYCTCDPNIAYAASSDAVYRSEDAGFTWTRMNRGNGTWGPPGVIAGLPIDMQCDPDDPLRIMVNNYLGGNFLSLDGGQTWNIASSGYTGSIIRDIAVSRENPAFVYAASRSGVYYSSNGGSNWFGIANPPEQLPAKFNEISTIAINPFNSQSIRTFAGDYPGVLYSFDGGSSWMATDIVAGFTELKFFPGDSSIMYGLASRPDLVTPPDDIPPDLELDPSLGLYSSHNAGLSWVQIISESVKGKCISSFEIDPYNPDILYVSTCDGVLLKTTDGGASWGKIGTGLPPIPALSLEISRSNNNTLYGGLGYQIPVMGNGLYKSTDGGISWNRLAAGLEANPTIKSIAIDPQNELVVYIADFYGGVFFTINGGETWLEINAGIDHREANTLEISADGTVLYLGTEGGGVYRLGKIEATTNHISINKQGAQQIELTNSFPNPFTRSSSIEFTVLNPTDLKFSVYNTSGQVIKEIEDSHYYPGHHSISWDGTNNAGSTVESGIYILLIRAGQQTQTVKLSYLQ